MQSRLKDASKREIRTVQIQGALRSNIEKLRNEKSELCQQCDNLQNTINDLKITLAHERRYNEEAIINERPLNIGKKASVN